MAILIDSVHVRIGDLTFILTFNAFGCLLGLSLGQLHLVLVCKQLLMLLRSELLQEFLLLDWVHLLECPHQLDGFLRYLDLLMWKRRLDLSRVHDVLALSFLLLGWDLIDDLVGLGWGLHVGLHGVLVFRVGFLAGVMASTL